MPAPVISPWSWTNASVTPVTPAVQHKHKTYGAMSPGGMSHRKRRITYIAMFLFGVISFAKEKLYGWHF